jgi:hypothetical protein
MQATLALMRGKQLSILSSTRANSSPLTISQLTRGPSMMALKAFHLEALITAVSSMENL